MKSYPTAIIVWDRVNGGYKMARLDGWFNNEPSYSIDGWQYTLADSIF